MVEGTTGAHRERLEHHAGRGEWLRRALLKGEGGSVTAEFAILIPMVLVILGIAISSITLSAHRVTLTSAAAEIARLEARGDIESAQTRLSQLHSTRIDRINDGQLLCVTLTARPAAGVLEVLEVRAKGCAAIVG